MDIVQFVQEGLFWLVLNANAQQDRNQLMENVLILVSQVKLWMNMGIVINVQSKKLLLMVNVNADQVMKESMEFVTLNVILLEFQELIFVLSVLSELNLILKQVPVFVEIISIKVLTAIVFQVLLFQSTARKVNIILLLMDVWHVHSAALNAKVLPNAQFALNKDLCQQELFAHQNVEINLQLVEKNVMMVI